MAQTEKTVTFKLSLPQARAMDVALHRGMRAVEAHDLIRDTRLAEEAIRLFRSSLPAR
jgi:hypothetical protein